MQRGPASRACVASQWSVKAPPADVVKALCHAGYPASTNQYSVTEYYHPVKKNEVELPSVVFLYDLSPITITITTQYRSLAHLLVRFCAVVGGVFAVTGLFDRWVHRLVTYLTARPR